MKMVSLKLTPAEAKEEAAIDYKPPEYPYGTQLDLSDDALDALGWSELPKVGDTLEMTATVKVARVSVYDSEGGGATRCVCLQIMTIGFGPDNEARAGVAAMLYGKK